MANKTYTVARAMTADGKDYARGDTRELSEGDAAHLLASGALTEGKAKPATEAKSAAAPTQSATVSAEAAKAPASRFTPKAKK